MADRDAEMKRLQEQLSEAAEAKEALQNSQGSSQSSQSDQNPDVRAAGDSAQAVQEELGRLRQEVRSRDQWGSAVAPSAGAQPATPG